MDQAFHTFVEDSSSSPDSSDFFLDMEEHCEKEHRVDYEAVLNMSDEDLVDVVSMLSMEY